MRVENGGWAVVFASLLVKAGDLFEWNDLRR